MNKRLIKLFGMFSFVFILLFSACAVVPNIDDQIDTVEHETFDYITSELNQAVPLVETSADEQESFTVASYESIEIFETSGPAPTEECGTHTDLFYAVDQFIDDLVSREEFNEWVRPLVRQMAETGETCLINLSTFIAYFGITREMFQEYLDSNVWNYFTWGGETIDVLFSGDSALIDQFFSIDNRFRFNDERQERQNRYWNGRTMSAQHVVLENTSEMSRYFHDIWTYSFFLSDRGWYYRRWIRDLIEAGEYDKINVVEFINHFDLGHPSSLSEEGRTIFEHWANEHNMNIFTHYNFDVLLSGDMNRILAYYHRNNEHLHSAARQARFDAHVARYGMPDTSWMLTDITRMPPRRITPNPSDAEIAFTSNLSTQETAITATQTTLAAWSLAAHTSRWDLVADIGTLSGRFILNAIGRRGNTDINLAFGTGSNAGQLFVGGWDQPNIFEKYWLIGHPWPVQPLGNALQDYDSVSISFSAHSSNTGPRNFILEAQIGSAWVEVGRYSLTTTTQHFEFILPDAIRNNNTLSIRFRVLNDVAVNNQRIHANGTSRIFNLVITGNHYDYAPEGITSWQFTTVELFDDNRTTATGGTYVGSTFGLEGGGNLTMGVGSAAGQLFVNGWGNTNGLTEGRWWQLNTSTVGYRNLRLTFGAHSSATGPANFVLEVNAGEGWVPVGNYQLISTAQRFEFDLPRAFADVPELQIRFRPANGIAVRGDAVQAAGTSRMYDVTLTGVSLFGDYIYSYTQDVQQGGQYGLTLAAREGTIFRLVYDATMVEITNIGDSANVKYHAGGVLVFSDALRVNIDFVALQSGNAQFTFE